MTASPSLRNRPSVRTVAAGGAILSLGAALVGPVSPADAAEFAVLNAGDTGAGSLRQAILDANAAPGPDLVTIPAGLGDIVLTTGEIAITEELTITGAGASSVVISGNDATRIFYVSGADSVTISGVTLSNGDAYGGGAVFQTGGDLTLIDTVLEDSYASGSGGALRFEDGGSFTATGITVSGNTAGSNGGGVSLYELTGSVSITGSTFTDNTGGSDGGGLIAYHVDGPVSVSSSRFTGNYAGSDGGAMVFEDTVSDITLTGLTVTDNEAPDDQAGGIFFYDLTSGDATISGSTITGNTAEHGGGVLFYDSEYSNLTITGSTITGNTSADSGGGGVRAYYSGNLTIVDSNVSGNHATSEDGANGGGIYFNAGEEELSTLTIVRSTVAGNDASADGGGIFANALAVEITNSTISGNEALGLGEAVGSGGGAMLRGEESVTVSHSTIAGNEADGDGGGLFVYDIGDVDIDHVILSGNTAAGDGDELFGMGGTIAIANSLIQGQVSAVTVADGGGNITGQDPQLEALADNGGPTPTHALKSTSPALDGGNPAFTPPPATDQRGLPRVQGKAIDIGAYETQPEPAKTPPPGTAPAARAVNADPTFTG